MERGLGHSGSLLCRVSSKGMPAEHLYSRFVRSTKSPSRPSSCAYPEPGLSRLRSFTVAEPKRGPGGADWLSPTARPCLAPRPPGADPLSTRPPSWLPKHHSACPALPGRLRRNRGAEQLSSSEGLRTRLAPPPPGAAGPPLPNHLQTAPWPLVLVRRPRAVPARCPSEAPLSLGPPDVRH